MKKLSDSPIHFDCLEPLITQCLSAPPPSVTDKPELLFNDDPHNYVSGRLYWWREGEKYVRRDGQPNPENHGPNFDRKRLGAFIDSVVLLSLAYKLTKDPKYAIRAQEYIFTWFINPKTRMNPNMEYAQLVPGKKSSGVGIIDTYDFYHLLGAITFLEKEGQLKPETMSGLSLWFKQFVRWLAKSRLGRKEQERPNNHGTAFDVQYVCNLLFIKREWRARYYLHGAKKNRLNTQIDASGSQPEENDRTKSLFYHFYNLSKLLHLAEMGNRTKVQLTTYKNKLNHALNFLMPFAERPDQWPQEQIEPVHIIEMFETIYWGEKLLGSDACRQFRLAHDEMTPLFDLYNTMSLPPSLMKKIFQQLS